MQAVGYLAKKTLAYLPQMHTDPEEVYSAALLAVAELDAMVPKYRVTNWNKWICGLGHKQIIRILQQNRILARGSVSGRQREYHQKHKHGCGSLCYESLIAPSVDPYNKLEQQEQIELALDIAGDDRWCVEQVYFKDRTLADIAQEIGVTAECVRQRINKALMKMRRVMEVA